jgi:CRP-like cAMP-binding protein
MSLLEAFSVTKTMQYPEFFGNRLFRGLSRQQVEHLFHAGTVVSLDDDTLVMEEGDPVELLSILVSGAVLVYLPRTELRPAQVNLSVLGPLECFGEYAFIDGQNASASIRTRGDTDLYQIPHQRLSEIVGTDPTLGVIVYRNLLSILVRRLRASNSELDLFNVSDEYTASV